MWATQPGDQEAEAQAPQAPGAGPRVQAQQAPGYRPQGMGPAGPRVQAPGCRPHRPQGAGPRVQALQAPGCRPQGAGPTDPECRSQGAGSAGPRVRPQSAGPTGPRVQAPGCGLSRPQAAGPRVRAMAHRLRECSSFSGHDPPLPAPAGLTGTGLLSRVTQYTSRASAPSPAAGLRISTEGSSPGPTPAPTRAGPLPHFKGPATPSCPQRAHARCPGPRLRTPRPSACPAAAPWPQGPATKLWLPGNPASHRPNARPGSAASRPPEPSRPPTRAKSSTVKRKKKNKEMS